MLLVGHSEGDGLLLSELFWCSVKDKSHVLVVIRVDDEGAISRICLVGELEKGASEEGHGSDGADDLFTIGETPDGRQGEVESTDCREDNLDNPLQDIIALVGQKTCS